MSNLLTDDEDLHIHIHGEKSVKIQFLDEDTFEGSGFDEVENEARVKASTAWLTIGKLIPALPVKITTVLSDLISLKVALRSEVSSQNN